MIRSPEHGKKSEQPGMNWPVIKENSIRRPDLEQDLALRLWSHLTNAVPSCLQGPPDTPRTTITTHIASKIIQAMEIVLLKPWRL